MRDIQVAIGHGTGALMVLQLYSAHVLSEPTLTVSPWFEARRKDYYDCLLGVSTDSRWDDW